MKHRLTPHGVGRRLALFLGVCKGKTILTGLSRRIKIDPQGSSRKEG